MKKTNEYEKQANDFLEKTGTKFSAKYLGNMPYFEDEKENRDIYQITLKRGKRQYSFRFGQSINDSRKYNKFGVSVPGNQPTAYDVLSCVTKNDPGTFSDFCSDFGYDTDSRKAEKTYFAVQEEYKNINMLFSDVMDELQEIN